MAERIAGGEFSGSTADQLRDGFLAALRQTDARGHKGVWCDARIEGPRMLESPGGGRWHLQSPYPAAGQTVYWFGWDWQTNGGEVTCRWSLISERYSGAYPIPVPPEVLAPS